MPGTDESAPYVQKIDDAQKRALVPAVKSYNNEAFLRSTQGRLIRILCEFEEPAARLRKNHIRSTVLLFGSARSMTKEEHKAAMESRVTALKSASDPQKTRIETEMKRLRSIEWMCEWMERVTELSKRIAEFSLKEKELINASFSRLPDYFRPSLSAVNKETDVDAEAEADLFHDLVVTTGGGPGFMEAANKGASSVPGALTMGMGISLPFEAGLNRYVTAGLAFTFHYFFTRKFWMMYSCRAIVIAPGGFGTMDEVFELLTLRQTRKIPEFPIVLFCTKFWKTVVNWEALAEFGTISKEEVDSLCFTDSVDEAVAFIRNFFVKNGAS
ncbi:putative lysine decarboxylase [Trypanosoma brucei equiperdum]|uniref:Putative lysine decarboxylase n=1 Tax=Trypanosoma brucei equiperdum TaxID=630700 RepID=A0A3L6LBB8_9TRYP|nr:putative lysine decarboxylase [Trypanosoma brucei equiperdum]